MRMFTHVVATVLILFTGACAATSARAVSGTWEFRAGDGSRLMTPFPWLIFSGGRTESEAVMKWPTGLGCQDEYGTFARGVMDFSKSHNPVIVKFKNSRTATLTFPDQPFSDRALRRVSRTTVIFCE